MKSYNKIIHTTCHTQWGTVEKRIFNESVWMGKNGQKIIIVAPKESPLFLKAKEYGFRVYGIDSKRFNLVKDYGFLKRLFRDEKPDIINHHGDKGSGMALSAAHKNGISLRILSRYSYTPIKNSWYNRRIYKKFSHYIFTSDENIRKQLQNVFKLKDMRIFPIPDGLTETEIDLKKKGGSLSDNPGNMATVPRGIDSMGRDVVRIYRLHQVRLDRRSQLQ